MSAPVTITALDRKLSACRKIFSSCEGWGPVGRDMILRGDMDEEPEFLRLMAAYEEGARNG